MPAVLAAQRRQTLDPRLSKSTAGPKPAIAINHLGYLRKARKRVIYRLTGSGAPPSRVPHHRDRHPDAAVLDDAAAQARHLRFREFYGRRLHAGGARRYVPGEHRG